MFSFIIFKTGYVIMGGGGLQFLRSPCFGDVLEIILFFYRLSRFLSKRSTDCRAVPGSGGAYKSQQ